MVGDSGLPVASTVRVRLASQTSLLTDAPPVDVEFDADVAFVQDRGEDGVHVRLKTLSGREDTLVLAIPDPSVMTFAAGERVHVRYASASFGPRDRRAGVVIRDMDGDLLFMVQDTGLPKNFEPPTPLRVKTGSRVTYTVATRDEDYCYRVVEHRAFRVFDGLSERTIAPGDTPIDFQSGSTTYRFVPLEHRVEARSNSCTAPLTPRVIWITYALIRSPKSVRPDGKSVETPAAVP